MTLGEQQRILVNPMITSHYELPLDTFARVKSPKRVRTPGPARFADDRHHSIRRPSNLSSIFSCLSAPNVYRTLPDTHATLHNERAEEQNNLSADYGKMEPTATVSLYSATYSACAAAYVSTSAQLQAAILTLPRVTAKPTAVAANIPSSYKT